jgi:quercetin dioxygenase-like cupin family protein
MIKRICQVAAVITLTSLVALGLSTLGTPIHAEEPGTPAGITAELLSEIELMKEFGDVGNRRLRMRVLTVPKGGHVAEHSHVGRPSLEYVLSGTATEFSGGQERTVQAGDAITADHTTVHAWRNDTDGDLVILAVDIYDPQ